MAPLRLCAASTLRPAIRSRLHRLGHAASDKARAETAAAAALKDAAATAMRKRTRDGDAHKNIRTVIQLVISLDVSFHRRHHSPVGEEPPCSIEQCIPHSFGAFDSHHQRPARFGSPAATGRVHGAQPIDV